MNNWQRFKVGSFPGRIMKNSKGQTLVEYGLLLVLIAVVIAAIVLIVGTKTCNMYSQVGAKLPDAGANP